MAGLQGRIFGGYELTEPLGSGGLCEVYRARPTRPGGREAVVKVIPPEFARQPGFLPHFRQVTQLAGRLANHAHILPLVGSGEEAGALYLISPYVADGTLKDWIVRGGRMGAGDVGPFFHQLCDALAYAHSLGVVHGDVKPSNIYLYEGRHVLLGDFGLLWDVAHMDMTHAGPGTEAVAFLAPEVANGRTSQASDIYSVGEVLFTAITGQPPFRANTPGEMFATHANQPVPRLQQVAPGLPPGVLALDAVIQRAMAKRPGDRFPSAMAVAQAIEAVTRQQPPQPQQPPGGPPVPFGMPIGGAPPRPAGGLPYAPLGLAAAPPPAAGPAPGAGLQVLNFPPLKGEVDGDMDQGRIVVSQHAPPTAPTLRSPGIGAGAGAPGFGPAPAPFALEPPTLRMPAPAPVPAPAAGLMRPPPPLSPGFPVFAPAPPSMVPPPTGAPPPNGDGYGPQAVPAIRIPPPDMGTRRQTGQQPAFTPGDGARQLPSTAFGQETGGRLPALADDFGDRQGHNGDYSASLESVEVERPFSPTELGLPRLTSPDLQELPPSWQELVREAPRQRRGEYGGSYRAGPEMSAEWAIEAPDGSAGDWNYAFSDGDMAAAAPRRKRRWPMRLALVVVLLVVVSLGALAVARPDLCPVSQCNSLSAAAHQYLPFLAQPTTSPEVSGQPTAVSITVAAGKSATVSLQFKDISTGSVNWTAATGLKWVSVSPSRGAVQSGGSVSLTLTADASAITPGKYSTTLTITAQGQVIHVPITITVQAGS